MKAFLTLILSFSFAVTALGQNSNTNSSKLIISAKIGATDTTFQLNRYEVYATVTIQNNSTDTIRYYHDICEDFFKSDNEEIDLDMIPCDTNGAVTEIVLPHQITSQIVHLHTILSQLKSKEFRIGLIYFYDIDMCGGGIGPIDNVLILKKREEAINNPIWSNKLYLK